MSKLTILFACAVLCSGCVATLPLNLGGAETTPETSPIQVPQTYRTLALNLNQLPPDSGLAMAAIVHMIRGEKPDVKGLTISPGLQLTEPGVPLENFNLVGITMLDRLEREVAKGKSWETKTMAVLNFELGPWHALVLTEAVTTAASTGMVLKQASVRTLSPAQPRTVAWFVPKAAFEAAITSDKALPVWEVMDLANSLGMPIGAGKPPSKEPQLAVVFVLDRLQAGDSVKGALSDSSAPPSRWTSTLPARDGIGFPMLLIDVQGPLNVATAEHFVHVTWRPADTSRTNGQQVDVPIGRFSTAKAFAKTASAPPTAMPTSSGNSAAPTASTAPKNVDINGSPRLLDIKSKNEALLVQGQLKKLGFYQGAVDGDFGKASQAALARFKKSRTLGENANWDIATQTTLFGASGP